MAGIFGGLAGKAEKEIKNRHKRIDDIVSAASKPRKKQKKEKNG